MKRLLSGSNKRYLFQAALTLVMSCVVVATPIFAQDLERLEHKRSTEQQPAPDQSVMPPSNDAYASALALTVGSDTFAASNVGATAEPGEPFHGAGRGGVINSVWYKYTASANSIVVFRTLDASPGAIGDTVVSAYTGSSLNTLTPIAENDDHIGTLYSQITFMALAGQTYYIAVDGFAGSFGAFNIIYSIGPPPPINDHRINATSLGQGVRSPYIGITGTNLGATGEPGEPNHNGNAGALNSIWYSWTPPATGSYTFSTAGSDFDTILAAYRSIIPGIIEPVGSNDDFGNVSTDRTSRVTFYASAGSTYYIAIDGYGIADQTGNSLLNWYPNREEAGKKYDLDGDLKSDISIFRPSNGQWWIKRSSGGTFATTFGIGSDKLAPADFTGDGKVDIAFWRPTGGSWYVLRSEDSSFYSFTFGLPGDIPATGHFDNDGLADHVIFRPSTGTWYIRLSRNQQTRIEVFGATGDRPVVADYDGDGQSDIAIFRPSNGQWWINRSRDGVIATTFGSGTDIPVPGAYTGHGRANVAFWRPSTGEWFVLDSPGGASYYSFPFGQSGDIPAPGDYDGDGKFDAAVFRNSNASWYINQTGGGFVVHAFGASGDRPVPATYTP